MCVFWRQREAGCPLQRRRSPLELIQREVRPAVDAITDGEDYCGAELAGIASA